MDVKIGGTYEVDDEGIVLDLLEPTHGNQQHRGTLIHRLDGNSVFVQLNGEDAADVGVTKAAGDGFTWIENGEAIRIPKGCTKLALKCAAGQSAFVTYLEA